MRKTDTGKGKGLAELRDARRKNRLLFWTVGFFSAFVNLLMLTGPLYMLQVYDRVLSSGSESTLLVITLLLLFLFLSMGLLEWMRSLILVRVSTKLETLLSSRLFTISFKQSLYSGGQNSTGQPLEDLTALRQFMTGNGLFAFFDLPWMPIYIAILFMFHPAIGWLAIATVIVLLVALIFWLTKDINNDKYYFRLYEAVIVIPYLLLTLFLLVRAKGKEDFSRLSKMIKGFMLLGILMLWFYFF